MIYLLQSIFFNAFCCIIEYFFLFIHRYKGKKKPDAVLAEICWWSKTIYQNQEDDDEEEEEQQQEEAGWQQSDESD